MEHEPEELPELPGPAILPTRAKDLLGISDISAEMMRGYLQAGMADELRHHFGINEDEARLTLRCADLATLPAWDAEAMLEAATVYSQHENDMDARYGYEGEVAYTTGIESMRRRIRLAMLAEHAPDVMRPPEALALMERAGVRVYFELRDAVIAGLLRGESVTDDDVRLYRRMRGIETGLSVDGTKSAPATVPPITKSAIAGAVPPATEDEITWQEKARAIADELDAIDAKAGAHDSKSNIADRVAEKMRSRCIAGPRGPLSGATVLREAIQGGKWKRKR